MGRVARELLAVSEMGQAALVPAMGAWYNVKNPHSEVGALPSRSLKSSSAASVAGGPKTFGRTKKLSRRIVEEAAGIKHLGGQTK